MLSSDAVLIRNGKETKVAAAEIVPGDVVVLQTGDKVPGDIRLLEVNNLACQEAALTGESVPMDKTTDPIVAKTGNPQQTSLGDRRNMCFSATLVSQGCGIGLVIATGDNTEIGNINSLVNHVQHKRAAVLDQIAFIAKALAIFICITAAITWSAAFFQLQASALDSMTIALTCAVAMIPAGLDAIVTMTYSWSVAKMAKQNAIIRKLPAVETLGSVTVICSDKTGTLTKNEMSLLAFVTSNARYKNNVDNKSRTASNFFRDDSFVAARAGHSNGESLACDINSAPGAHRQRKQADSLSMHGQPSNLEGNDDTMASGSAPVGTGQLPSHEFIRQALAGGVLCSKCTLGKAGIRDGEIGNPTELSLLRACYFADIDVEGMKRGAPIVAEVPFSSEYKFMATVHEPKAVNDGSSVSDSEYVVHTKGAPDHMIKVCSSQAKAGRIDEIEPIDASYWTHQIEILSSHGLRVLALCRGTVKKSEVKEGDQLKADFVNGRDKPWLTMVGLCAIMDPPRPECVAAIAEAHTAGVRVAMITGDHKETALAIGAQLGLVDDQRPSAITGAELDAMNEEELKKAVMTYNLFARSSPENKIQIVKALQAQGEVASMTGDGVNDAPALKGTYLPSV
jgi:magnesium-transporting ATPase (P-type)